MTHNLQDPVLLQILRHSLSEWPALQLAIDQGMGGPDAREKQVWMGQVIHDFLQTGSYVVDEDELYDYIADMMDNEFDTIVDDGSMNFLIKRIAYFCKLQSESKEQELQTILDRKCSEAKKSAPKPSDESANEPSASSSSSLQPSNNVSHEAETMSEDVPKNVPNEEDSEWKVVDRSRKSNRKV